VNVQSALLIESLVAHLTMDRPLARMEVRVLFENSSVGECLWTQRTGVLSFARMEFGVGPQSLLVLELGLALDALVDVLCGRVDRMGALTMAVEEFLKTKPEE
jgi:hypothetical protein